MAATKRVVDLSDVTGGGNFKPRRKLEGEYRAKIVKVDDHLKEGKTPGWVYTIQVDGDSRSTYPYYVNPEKKQAWKIGTICRAAGLPNVIGKRINFDPNKLVNKPVGIYLMDDEYEGREKSAIDDIFPIDEVTTPADEDSVEVDTDDEEIVENDEVDIPDEEEEEEPEPTPPPRKTRRKPAPVIEEPEEDEEEEEEPPAPVRRRRKPAPAPEPEEDEDEEEEPAPTPARRTRKAPATRQKPAPVVEDDDLDDLEIDDLED
jgi:hypothetical protein